MLQQDTAYHVLRLLGTPGIGAARLRVFLRLVQQRGEELSSLLADRKALSSLLSEQQIESLEMKEAATRETWEELGTRNVTTLAISDSGYPERLRTLLGEKAPPLITVLGNQALLDATSVGFCGSRKASDKGLAAAADCADQFARAGVNVVSGYAAGVDMECHKAALKVGGTTTLVLAEGILHFKVRKALESVWDWQRVAVVSMFMPRLGWKAHNAMERNRLICGLSQAMILVEARSKGGSIEAGRTCLRMGEPLFAAIYEGMPDSATGNDKLLREGAHPLRKSRSTGRANIQPVTELLQREG